MGDIYGCRCQGMVYLPIVDVQRVDLVSVQAVDKYGGASLPGSTGVGRGVVFLAWGGWAAKRVAKLDKVSNLTLQSRDSLTPSLAHQKKHCILTSAVSLFFTFSIAIF